MNEWWTWREQLRQNESFRRLGCSRGGRMKFANPLTVMKMLYHSLDLKFPAGDPRDKDARIISEKNRSPDKSWSRFSILREPLSRICASESE